MNRLGNVLKNAAGALRIYASGASAATWGMFNWLLAGARIDYKAKAGVVFDNSAVLAPILWLWRNAQYCRMVVEAPTKDDKGKTKFEEVIGHLLPVAVENGPFYDDTTLWHGTWVSWMVDGNAYWVKVRSAAGKVVGYIFIPHWQIMPMADKYNPNGTLLITYYRYEPLGGTPIELNPADVVHFRNGMDPRDPKRGLSPLMAALREIVGDNEASTLGVALSLNGGISGVVFSPKDGTAKIDPDQAEAIKAKWKRNTTGDMAGVPQFLPFAADAKVIGWKPRDMDLSVQRQLSVTRICALVGVDPIVCSLDRDHMTLDNYGKAVEATYEGTLLPNLEIMAKQLTRQSLIPDFGGAGMRIGWDTSRVAALQEDQDALFTRWGTAFAQGIAKRKTALQATGQPFDDKLDDVYASDLSLSAAGVDPAMAPSDAAKQAALHRLQAEMRSRTQKNREAYERIQAELDDAEE